jgi:hypothetical protein
MIRSAVTVICLEILTLQGTLPAEAPRATFTMTIATEQNIIEPGSEIALDVDLVNVSDMPIELAQVRYGGSLYRCTVLDQDGIAAPLTRLGDAILNSRGGYTEYTEKNGVRRILVGSALSRKIAPGEKLRDTFPLSLYVDLSRPSRYTIRLERTDPYTKRLVQSNTRTLTVRQK